MPNPCRLRRVVLVAFVRCTFLFAGLAATCPAQDLIDVFLPGRHADKVMAIPVGVLRQKALLEDGSIALADTSNQRIDLLAPDGTFQVVAQFTNTIDARSVAPMPGNRVAYATGGEIRVRDLATGHIDIWGAVPEGDLIQAMGSDGGGHVYTATGQNKLYRFDPEGRRDVMVSNLPFGTSSICDVAVGRMGEVYVSGSGQVVRVQSGAVNVVAEGLSGLVWVAARPDGKIYFTDSTKRLQLYDPSSGTLAPVTLPISYSANADILVPSDDVLIFQSMGAFFRYDFSAGVLTTVMTIDGNNKPFTVAGDGYLYIGTMWRTGILNSRLARLPAYGSDTLEYLDRVPVATIQALATDSRGRLGMIEGNELKRIEDDGSLTTFSKYLPPNFYGLAMGAGTDWFVTAHNFSDTVKLYRLREGATSAQLILTIDGTLLPGAKMSDFSAAFTPNGELAMVVSATKPGGSYQRVFRSNADGSSLREVANLDSVRESCQVDIGVAPNSDLYVLGCSNIAFGSNDEIYRLDASNITFEAVRIAGGNGPASLAVDDQGGIWFSTGSGIYRVPEAPVSVQPRILSVSGILHSASWTKEIASNTWISIFGTNLAARIRSWAASDFVGGRLPTQLDGVSVTIGGKPAYISYASPAQLNVLVPDLGPGTYEVQAVTQLGASNRVNIRIEPFAPALFRFDAAGGRYAAAVHPGGGYVGDGAVFAGLNATPAKPGEIISLYGAGFGPTVGNPDTGALISSAYDLANTVTLSIGGVNAPVRFAGLVGAGLVQLNVEVPRVADGDQPVTGTIGGTALRGVAYLTVKALP